MKELTIPQEVCSYIERLNFEYNALLNILRYITKEGSKKEYIDIYTRECIEKYTELEMAKQSLIDEALPGVKLASYNITFADCRLTFEEVCDE